MPSTTSISPVSSPFDDSARYDYSSTAHLTHTQTGTSSTYDTSYHGASTTDAPHPYNSRYDSPPAAGQGDPFADQNAIPLQQHNKMGEAHGATAGVYSMDPEERYPREKRRKKKGWLNSKHTWVVYFLTAVQIGVFIGELVKNGMRSCSLYRGRMLTIVCRCPHGHAHTNETQFQHYDRPFALRPHQHGRPLPALHALRERRARRRPGRQATHRLAMS